MPKSRPDAALVRDQLQAVQAVLSAWGVEHTCSWLFWVLAKEEQYFEGLDDSTKMVPFRFNRVQRDLEKNLARNNLYVKGRQYGSTTYFGIRRLLLPAIVEPGVGCLLESQNNEYAEKHFSIIIRALKYVGAVDPRRDITGDDPDSPNTLCISLKQNLLHTSYSTRREVIFDQLDSKMMVGSAEVEESGQGPTLHHVLGDEYSRWPGNPEATLSNIRGALVKTGTTDLACTANSAAGDFYERVLRALNDPEHSDAKLHFHAWWWDEGYSYKLTDTQKDEMEKDLTSEELKIIRKIHKDLADVAWIA
jgi:hypothetical protein